MAGNKISAVIIARDEAHAIADCLQSVSFADEIVLVDSGSQDETPSIAKRFGARVIHQDWLGFGAQKQFAVEQASHDWILSIDADERVSPELRESILQAVTAPQAKAFEMPRCNRFMGRWLRHGEGYPDYNLRLFHRDHARWSEDAVHEHVLAEGPVHRLKGDLLHESEDGIADYLRKQNTYTSLQAQALFDAGKKVGTAKLLMSPLLRFVKFYFFRRGFLDGVPGLVHILIGCFNSFAKYAKLMEMYR